MARAILFVFLLSLVAPHILGRGIGGFDDKSDSERKDIVSDIFKSAIESGAEVVQNPNRPTENNAKKIVLKLWRQGFTVDDGELRPYNDPQNKEFLECISKGKLPPELSQSDNCGNMIEVNMEDHRNEDFIAPKPKPFGGKGQALNTPTLKNKQQDPAEQTAKQNEENEKIANEKLNVDESQPTTIVQIRLADGNRLSVRVNLSHTINDLRNFILNARPQYATQSFVLMNTFPKKELTDLEQTVEKAGIANAAIMQRLK